MNKYTIILLTVLQSFSIQAMSRITSQTSKVAGLRPVAALGLKNPVKAVQPRQVRSIVDTASLVGSYASMSDRAFSPLRGAIAYENGFIKKMLQTECPEVTAKFFNDLDGTIRFTVFDSNPALALNAELIGELLKELQQGTLYINKEVIASGPIGQKWHALYVQTDKSSLNPPKVFRRAVRKLINALEELKDDTKVRELLLAALYVKAVTHEEVIAYVAKMDEKQSLKFATSDRIDLAIRDKMYEKVALKLIDYKNDKNHLHFLKVPDMSEGWKGYSKRPMCAEKALWTMTHALLYNHETGCLDLSLLPESVQKSCNPAFRAFIENYPKLPVTNDTKGQFKEEEKYRQQEQRKQDFLSLVWGIDQVQYIQKEEQYELAGSAASSLILLNRFFGTQVQSYIELAAVLSSKERTVKLTDCKEYGEVQVTIQDEKNKNNIIEGTWSFSSRHVFLGLKGEKEDTAIRRYHLYFIALAEFFGRQKKGTLLRLLNNFIAHKIDWKKDSREDVECFFDEYAITQEEIQAPITNVSFINSYSLLHKAVSVQRIDLARLFLEKGITADTVDGSGASCLEYMWNRHMKLSERVQYIRLLLPLMKNQDLIIRELETAIDIGHRLGHRLTHDLQLVEIALDAAIHLDKKQCGHLVHKAVNKNNKALITLLAKKGISVNALNNKGETSLDVAIKNNNRECIEILRAAGGVTNV